MPNYGLDRDQRGCKPWRLPKSVLVPGKVITDPVHGDIFLTKLEIAMVDSRAFQRLRRIRQLGNTHLVYPGAVHTRFSH
jgi:HD superfamily phosphohydrolase